MSHGVTSNTAGLNYSGESGGLNEATSDIFGTGVEFYANNSTDVGDYLIGEKIDINGDGTPLRYMDKPSKDGGSADSWSSSVGNKDVHYSSGVANHFFYLLSEGSGAKTINGVCYNSPTSNGSTVTGIGRAKALQIWYKALTTYFTSTTNYAGGPHRHPLRGVAPCTAPRSAEYKAVAAAWSGGQRQLSQATAARRRAAPGTKTSPGAALLLAPHALHVRGRRRDPRGSRCPPGFHPLHVRTRIGEGEAVFRAPPRRLTTWEMHRALGVGMAGDADRAAPGVDVTVTRRARSRRPAGWSGRPRNPAAPAGPTAP